MIVISSSVPNIEAILVKSFQNMRQLAVSVQWTALKLNRQPQLLPGFQIWKSAAATKAWPDSFDCCGVEHLNLNAIRPDQAVCRVLDPHHQKGMFDYLLWGVLYFQRYFDRMIQQQKQQLWKQYRQSYSHHIQIGIMGLGHMGGYVAERFADMGYQVSGWSNSPKDINQVKSYVGQEQLSEFLAQSQILINLLPLPKRILGFFLLNYFSNCLNSQL